MQIISSIEKWTSRGAKSNKPERSVTRDKGRDTPRGKASLPSTLARVETRAGRGGRDTVWKCD
jgi:hypothetical protein